MTAAYLVDGQGPVYAPTVGYPAGSLRRGHPGSPSARRPRLEARSVGG
jgi:hypothetical protein